MTIHARLMQLAAELDAKATERFRSDPTVHYSDRELRTQRNDADALRRMAMRYDSKEPQA